MTEQNHTQTQLQVNSSNNGPRKMRILIAEPENDIQSIYKKCLASAASELTFVSSSKDLVECAFNNNGNNRGYDVAIIDLHLDGMKGEKLGTGMVRKIAETLPDLRVIVTTTSDSKAKIKEQLFSCGIGEENILVKPFSIAELLSKIKPPPTSSSAKRKVMLSDHVIAIYDSFEDEIQDAVAYFKGALEKNETMMLIFRKDLTVSLLKSELQRNGLDNIDQLLADYSLILIRDQTFYAWSAANGNVTGEQIISRLEQLIKISKDSGKKGIRSFAMTDSWFNNGMQSKLVEYEHSLPEVFDIPFIGVCAYLRHHVDSLTEGEREKIMACHNLVWAEPVQKDA